MVKRDKRIAAMRRNPQAVRPDELDTVLRGAGFTARQQGTSHKVYSYGPYRLPVPQHPGPLKPTYVRQALALLDKISAEDIVGAGTTGEGDTAGAGTTGEGDTDGDDDDDDDGGD